MTLSRTTALVMLVAALVLTAGGLRAATETAPVAADIPGHFLTLLTNDGERREASLEVIEEHWEPSFVPMALEVLRFSRVSSKVAETVDLLERKTGQSFGYDLNAWYRWLWNTDEPRHPHYAEFKRLLYEEIDPRFAAYFADARPTRIRLDEIVWGGVRQDGIPPLRRPKMIAAQDADYLEDEHVVFAIEVNGDARAYPKRIMGWHEMFVDKVGGLPVAGVYCTLCGTMILYETRVDGTNHALGTSGFLYRSNKLMYDKKTQSLWNTLHGTPVVGPLATKEIRLPRRGIVTTTWGEWRRRHPDTTVLSLDTGHRRDYGEGAAYRDYFATDELMFSVPVLDQRLKNKDEVLGLIFPQNPGQPLAISAAHLSSNPVYHDRIGERRFVVLTDASGANRVYEANGVVFESWDRDATVRDVNGVSWTLTESKLSAADGRVLYRIPAHRAFWFGWYSAYAHTRLVGG